VSGAAISRALGKRADMVVHTTDPYNAEPPPGALATGPLTPVDTFYVRNHGPVPDAGDDWGLRIDGRVARPLQLTRSELRNRFGARRETVTLQCAGNRRAGLADTREIPGEAPWGPGATGTAEWTGASLADVLAAAGVAPEAHYVELTGADESPEAEPPQRFGASIPLRKALAGEVLLAWAMNGEPLIAAHGAPLRAIVPGYIGARSVKWLTRITVRETPSENFFQAQTYRLLPADAPADAGKQGEGVALGAVAVNADFLEPADGATVAAGPLMVAGYAFAGDDRHIVRVDVSTDGGHSWRQADLLDGPSRWAWRRWAITLDVAPGPVEVVARAWDSAAATQPSDPAQLWNPKGYANNAWARLRLTVS
jgi:sulfite oxidase